MDLILICLVCVKITRHFILFLCLSVQIYLQSIVCFFPGVKTPSLALSRYLLVKPQIKLRTLKVLIVCISFWATWCVLDCLSDSLKIEAGKAGLVSVLTESVVTLEGCLVESH